MKIELLWPPFCFWNGQGNNNKLLTRGTCILLLPTTGPNDLKFLSGNLGKDHFSLIWKACQALIVRSTVCLFSPSRQVTRVYLRLMYSCNCNSCIQAKRQKRVHFKVLGLSPGPHWWPTYDCFREGIQSTGILDPRPLENNIFIATRSSRISL